MNIRSHSIAFQTILIKETLRFLRIWIQTLLPPAITTALYFIIFGKLIGARLGAVDGLTYSQYIAPGLIMHPRLAAHFPEEHVQIDAENLLTPESGTPEDIAHAVVFLASDQARFINAQVLSVDGGILAHTPFYAQARALGQASVAYTGRE